MSEPPSHDDQEGDLSFFLPRVVEEVRSEAPLDPVGQLRALKRAFPGLPEGSLEWFLSKASQSHVEAALRDLTKRTRHTLGIFLRGRGRAVSDDFVWEDGARMGGNFVFIRELRDEGFVIDSRPVSNGTLFVLSFEAFNERASRRDALTSRRRRAVLDFYGQCLRCGSKSDLEADHRVAVLVGDAPSEAPFLVTDWQALCRSCNSLKSQACEQCPLRDRSRCLDCFWAHPEDHTHRAGEPGFWFSMKLPESFVLLARKLRRAPGALVERIVRMAVEQKSTKGSVRGTGVALGMSDLKTLRNEFIRHNRNGMMQSVGLEGKTHTHVKGTFWDCMNYVMGCRMANSAINFALREKYSTPQGWGSTVTLRVVSAEDPSFVVYEGRPSFILNFEGGPS